jgi:hypothetical protein
MALELSVRTNLDELIPAWKEIQEKFNSSVEDFISALADRGVGFMKDHMQDYTYTGKLVQSVRKGRYGRTGIAGRRGYFGDVTIHIDAPHALFVDEGTSESPGGYFQFLVPQEQHSVLGGRISKGHISRGQFKPHPGIPARHFRRDTVDHLADMLDQDFDDKMRWLFK